jgi:deoxyadenosine/deoxycytidine kinase
MKKFEVIDGGVHMREKTVMPELYGDPHDEPLEREFILNLLDDCDAIFKSYDVIPDSIPQEDIDVYKSVVTDTIRKTNNAEPRVYDYYLWLYDRFTDVLIHPEEVPNDVFTAQVVAILQLAGVASEPINA